METQGRGERDKWLACVVRRGVDHPNQLEHQRQQLAPCSTDNWYGKDEGAPVVINNNYMYIRVTRFSSIIGKLVQCSNLDHVFGIGSKHRVEDKVAQPSMLSRTVMIEIDEVFYIIV